MRDFIETGTYYGDTAAWASRHFEHVITIEKSPTIYVKALARHGSLSNVRFILDDSRTALKTVVAALSEPAIFWLDSHWSGEDTWGEHEECPLLDELVVISRAPCAHFLFIDDARLFAAPPLRPHRLEQWPPIDTVIETLKSGQERYIVLIQDVIIAAPGHARTLLADYYQDLSTRAWQQTHFGGPTIAQGMALIGQGVKMLLRSLRSRQD